jgi:hypothetical protein
LLRHVTKVLSPSMGACDGLSTCVQQVPCEPHGAQGEMQGEAS